MKKLLTLLTSLLLLTTMSCNRPHHDNDMACLLEHAKSPVIVISTGINEGNNDSYRYYIIFKDADGVIYEYVGAKYTLEVGDTIK